MYGVYNENVPPKLLGLLQYRILTFCV